MLTEIMLRFSVCAETVIHGDAISPNIAAASVIAKVTRDRICEELDKNILGTELPSTRVILLRRIMKHLQDLDQVIVIEEVFGWNEVNIYRKEWDLP